MSIGSEETGILPLHLRLMQLYVTTSNDPTFIMGSVLGTGRRD